MFPLFPLHIQDFLDNLHRVSFVILCSEETTFGEVNPVCITCVFEILHFVPLDDRI